MDFYVFFEDCVIYCFPFMVGPDMFGISFREIVNRFWDRVKLSAERFVPPSNFRLFYDDISNPLEPHTPVEIEDLSKPISSLPVRNFDLIITGRFEPTQIHSPPPAETRIRDLRFEQSLVRARTYMKNGEFFEASNALGSAEPFGEDEIQLLSMERLSLLIKMKNYRQALENVQDLVKKHPGKGSFQFMLAKISQRMGLHEEAIDQFKRYLILAPNDCERYDLVNLYVAKSLYAMEHFDQAETLVQQIVNNDAMNVKARVLLAKILAKQGRLSEGLHLVIRNFAIEPDDKSSRKFIATHVVNDKQVELLKSELGDSVKSAQTMFYVGHMLWEFGSCHAADSFMRQAVELAPKDPAVFVGALRNLFCLSLPPSKFFEFAKVAIDSLPDVGEDYQDINQGVDFSKCVSDFELTEEKPAASDINPVEMGKPICPYDTENCDAMWVLILIHTFMFSRGFITSAEQLDAKIRGVLRKFDFNASILYPQVDTFVQISQNSVTIPRPLIERKAIFVIGDEFALNVGYRTIKYQDTEYNLIPIYLMDGHATDIVSQRRNPCQTTYSIEFEKIPDGSMAIFLFSKLSCSDRIRGVQEPREAAFINTIATQHCDAMSKLTKHWVTNKHGRVWGFPVYSMETIPLMWCEVLRQINKKLAFHMWSLNQSVPEIGMIDVFEDLADVETRMPNPAYVTDSMKLRPTVIPLIEKAINSTESRLHEYLSAHAPI